MNRVELARMLDHSVLKPESTERDIVSGAGVVRAWRIGYYCVQPCWVALSARRSLTAAARDHSLPATNERAASSHEVGALPASAAST